MNISGRCEFSFDAMYFYSQNARHLRLSKTAYAPESLSG